MQRVVLYLCALAYAGAALAPQPRWLMRWRFSTLHARCSVDCSTDEWDKRELWALEDSVPRYSLQDGELVLWRRMALDVPELIERSPEELRARWLALQGAAGIEPASAGDPPSLENWKACGEGKFEGDLFGVHGVQDGRLRAVVRGVDGAANGAHPEAARWCVRTAAGDLFQLGVPRRDAEAAEEGNSPRVALLAPDGCVEETIECAMHRSDKASNGLQQSSSSLARSAAIGLSAPILFCAVVYALIAASGYHVDVNIFIV